MKSQCLGLCCAAFPLPKGSYADLVSGKTNEQREEGMVRLKDILVPLTQLEAHVRIAQVGSGFLAQVPDPGNGEWFTCNQWDKETKRCKVYERRPIMCRDFPYGKRCEHSASCHERGTSLQSVPE